MDILSFITNKNGATRKEIEEYINLSQTRVITLLKEMLELNLIKKEKKDVPVPAYNRDAMERVTTFLTTGRKDPLRLFISCTEMKEEFYNRVMRGAETEYIDTRLEKASRDAGKTMPRRVDFPTVGDGSRLYTVTDMMNGIKMHTDILYIVKAPVIWAVEFDYPEDVPGLGARVREALEDVQAWTTGEPGK